MLNQYLADTRRLLQNPPAPSALYAADDLTNFINRARGQLAGEAECIRRQGTLLTVQGTQVYDFSSINLGVSANTGISAAIHVRSLFYGVGDGRKWVTPRGWEWFELYKLNNPVPQQSFPGTWAQYGQGAAPGSVGTVGGGSIYIDPVPDNAYTLYLDCVCFPIPLVDDTTAEAIPYLWTDCVPFFAAFYALLSAQANARMADAERYYNHYQMFLERARKSSNPSVNRWMYQQAADPTQAMKLGIKAGAPAGGG